MVSYGFESYERLTQKIGGIPEELISRDPRELKQRILHTFDLRDGVCGERDASAMQAGA